MPGLAFQTRSLFKGFEVRLPLGVNAATKDIRVIVRARDPSGLGPETGALQEECKPGVSIGLPHMVEVPGDKVELELEISVFIDPGQESVQWMRRPERVQSAGVSVLPSRSPE